MAKAKFEVAHLIGGLNQSLYKKLTCVLAIFNQIEWQLEQALIEALAGLPLARKYCPGHYALKNMRFT